MEIFFMLFRMICLRDVSYRYVLVFLSFKVEVRFETCHL